MNQSCIAVIGNLNIDLIIRGIREMPVWGQESMGSSHVAASAGQAGSLALGLANLGDRVAVVSILGGDEFGRQIHRDLAAAGVDLSAVEQIEGERTAITVGIVRNDGERSFVSDFTPLDRFDENVVRRHWDELGRADVVCLVGIFCVQKFALNEMTTILRELRKAGKTTVVDTGWDPGNWRPETVGAINALLAEVDIFLPNLDEARAISGVTGAEDAARILSERGPSTVVVKCGADGCLAVHRGDVHVLPALLTDVQDTVGAGDSFNAGFLHALVAGWPVSRRLAFGNACASIYIERLTDRFASEPEGLDRMARYPAENA